MIIISTIISTNLDQICNQSKNVDIKKIACYRHIYTRALVQKVKTYGQTTKFTLKNRGNYGLHRSFKENLKIATISIFEDKRKTRGRQKGRQKDMKKILYVTKTIRSKCSKLLRNLFFKIKILCSSGEAENPQTSVHGLPTLFSYNKLLYFLSEPCYFQVFPFKPVIWTGMQAALTVCSITEVGSDFHSSVFLHS